MELLNIWLRPAEDKDCDLLYKWANDETVRENAFNTNYIIYEDHKKWFQNKLNSDTTLLFICCLNQEPIGQIRLDMENGNGIIDYSIDKKYRGKGYGTCILKEILKVLTKNNIRIDKVIGRVKYQNRPSQKAFTKAGYNCNFEANYIEYYKHLQA